MASRTIHNYLALLAAVCIAFGPRASGQTSEKTQVSDKSKSAHDAGSQGQDRSLKDKVDALEVEKRTLIMHIRRLQDDKDKLAKMVRNLKAPFPGNSELNVRLNELTKKLEAATKDRDNLKAELAGAQSNFNNLNKAMLNKIKEQTAAERAEKTALLQALEKEKENLQRELSLLKETSIRERKDLETKLASLKDKQLSTINANLQEAAQHLKNVNAFVGLDAGGDVLETPNDSGGGKKISSETEADTGFDRDTMARMSGLVKAQARALGILQTERDELCEGLKSVLGDKKGLETKLQTMIVDTNRQRLNMHFNLAVKCDQNRMYKEAESEYLKALAIADDDPDIHYNLGILYDDKLGDAGKAVEHYRRFLALKAGGADVDRVKEWLARAERGESSGSPGGQPNGLELRMERLTPRTRSGTY